MKTDMIEMNSKETLSAISPNFKIRVSEKHPLDLYVGKNDQGLPFLEFCGVFSPKKVNGTGTIAVKQEILPNNKRRIRFLLSDFEFADNFYKFIDDMVISSSDIENPNIGYVFLTDRYTAWKKTFGPNLPLTHETVQGLIGELLFLRDYAIPKYGESNAILGWSGTEKTSKDFSVGDEWFEIKAVSSQSRAVTISSIDQLESTKPGFLVVFVLDRRSAISEGINLNSLVQNIDASLSSLDNKLVFRQNLLRIGYQFGKPDNDNYSNLIYESVETNFYKVAGDFPVIHRTDIDKRIADVSYRISLNDITDYKVEKESDHD